MFTMKNALLLICMVFMSIPIFAQHFTSKSRYERLMSKSREKKTAAFICLGGGAAATAAGLLLFNSGLNNNDGQSVLGFFLTGIGIGSMSTSIPLFILAHRNRKNAMSMSMKTENAAILYKNGFSRQFYPVLQLQIPLGR